MQPLLYMKQWTYLGVLFSTLLGNLGLPLPEEVIFTMAGFLAAEGYATLWIMLIFSVFVIVLTDNLSFFVGRLFGKPLFGFLKRFKGLDKMIHKTESFMECHGNKTVFISRFIWNVRNWVPLLAGASKMKWKDFRKYNFYGALIYTPILVVIGYFFSEMLGDVIGAVKNTRFFIFVFFVVFVLFYVFKLFYQRFFANGNGGKCSH